jgi:hypothetical protein
VLLLNECLLVLVYFVIDSVWKLVDTPSYTSKSVGYKTHMGRQYLGDLGLDGKIILNGTWKNML